MQKLEIITSNELVDYPSALQFMEKRVEDIIAGAKSECIWLLQHPPLYTSGTSAKEADLLSKDFPVYKAGRGGEFTYHGPGQRVMYVMIKLEPQDIRKFVWRLEEVIIQTLKHFGINAERREGRIGIWVITNKTPLPQGEMGGEAKIAAIGIRVRKWVGFHGIAVNINPNLEHFNGIVPCGISEYGVTSMENLGVDVDMQEFDDILVKEFREIFEK